MPYTDSNALPFSVRPDLSPFLVHLTRTSKSKDGFTAFQNLVSILLTGEIFGSKREPGFIKGSTPASCFMDVPLGSLKYVLNAQNTNPSHPRYGPYGVVISKEYAYKHGCRPVLYLSNKELDTLNIPSELWRVVRLEAVDGTGINWLHEREWRCKGSFKMPSSFRAVLVKTPREAQKLQEVLENKPSKVRARPLSVIPLTVLCQGLPY